ncbi:MAG: class I SAM-dependent methyltransferase [Nocardioidaceae bacterium]
MGSDGVGSDGVGSGSAYREVGDAEAEAANRADWDAEADDYQREHGAFLGDTRFVWCPEGLDEATAHLLGDVSGRRALDLGCGAAQCARWLRLNGATAIGLDLSFRQLQHSHRIDADTDVALPVVCGSVSRLPFADGSFDVVASAFGALPFVVDIVRAVTEVTRVLSPGGLFAFSVVHPVRRMFPDDPSHNGLTIIRSYFDRSSYVEVGPDGAPSYVEPHHTMGDWVGAIEASGLRLQRLVEPTWPAGHDRVWGGWGPVRGSLLPGTAIFLTRKP